MKTKQTTSTKKSKYPIHLFAEVIAYRVPFPVTKVIVYGYDNVYPLCPKCSMGLEREYMSFYDRCGQKLNWDLFALTRVVRQGSKRK